MKHVTLAALTALGLGLASCSPTTDKTAGGQTSTAGPNKDLNALFAACWDKTLRLFPLDATVYGDNRFNDQLPNDQTRAYRDTLQAFYAGNLARLAKFDREKLDANDKISYDIFQYETQHGLAGLKLNTWMLPANQFRGLPITLGQFGSGQSIQPFKM